MSRFLNLCSCEFIKIMKKRSSKVMLIILIAAIFAAAGIAVLTKKMYSYSEEYLSTVDYKTMTKTELESLKADIEANSSVLDEASKNSLQAQVDVYQMAMDYDINIYNTYWKSNVLTTDLLNSKTYYYNYISMGDEKSALVEQANIDKKVELLKNDDFDGYMELQKQIVKSNYDNNFIDKDDYENQIHTLELRQKYQVGKDYDSNDSWKEILVEEIEVLNNNVKLGIDTLTQKTLSEKDLEKAKDTIKMNEYRLEHNMQPYMTATSVGSTRKIFDYMQGGLTLLVLAVMMIIIAGSSISSEISKGTIKFWSFTPNKRWKILLSKLCVSVFILVAVSILVTLLSTLIGNIFFGSKDAQGYLYVSGGEVHSINYIVYMILYNLVGAIEVFVFLLFAMMLSTVTRNTAVSVGISIATYFGGNVIMQIINLFVKSDWIKFIPLNNLSLADRIFTNDVSYSASSLVTSLTGNISVNFSLAVLGVCAVIMIVTMFDSFRKRDIL